MSVGGVGRPQGWDAPSVGGSESAGGAAAIKLGSALKDKPALAGVAGGTQTVEFGARGEAARALQEGLAQLGYLRGGVDGIFGRGTQSAVAEFQRASGLPATGAFDQATLAALDQALQMGARKRAPGAAVPNQILFIGMGDHAAYEAGQMQRFSQGGVLGITDSRQGDDEVALTVGGRAHTFDLTTPEGRDGFVRSIGLSGAKAQEAASIIEGAGADAKDEIAMTIKAFAEAERGERTLERMVMSGHSVGTGPWGDSNGQFDYTHLERIAAAFPNAARQVEDFLLQGCYSGEEPHMDRFQAIFPNLKSATAYTDSAPGSYTGAVEHERLWEAATRGHDPSRVDRDIFRGTRKGENVSTWNAVDGYQSANAPRPASELRAAVQAGRATYESFMRGDQNVVDTQTGPLRDFYRSVQAALGSREITGAERAQLEALRDTSIRMIFYDGRIKGKFQQTHAAAIRDGFAALGMPAPDFSRLSRKDALAQVAAFEQRLAAASPKPAAAQALLPLLTEGLRDLNPSRIPSNWV